MPPHAPEVGPKPQHARVLPGLVGVIVEHFAGMCDHYARQLERTDYAAGCPAWAVAQEAPSDPTLGPIVAQTLQDWVEALGHELAPFAIASLKGAITLARVQRSTAPIDVVRERVGAALR